MEVWGLGVFLLGFSLFLILYLRPFALRFSLLDPPDLRKQHAEPTPLVGGLGMFLSLFLSAFLLQS